MLCVLTWKKYSNLPEWAYYCIYVFVVIFGAAVISARKHYTLDVVVAMYTVPLLWIAYDHKYPDKLPPDMLAAEQVHHLSLATNRRVLPHFHLCVCVCVCVYDVVR
jgi:hypothetical protein